MVVSIKDTLKLAGIAIVACCAVFVCTLFLNYSLDLAAIENAITSEAGAVLYHAQRSMGRVICAVTGGCLSATSVVMLLFYVRNYIDAHGKELGILKALGYSNREVAAHFWVFGLSVLTGCALGFGAAYLYMPTFYGMENTEQLFPELAVRFHPILGLFLVVVPTLFFMLISVLYAWRKLTKPVLDLLKEKQECRHTISRARTKNLPFLQDVRKNTVRDRKALAFLICFSSFCFSAMTQMSFSMHDLSSEAMAMMMIVIGLILAYVTLFLALTAVLKANIKTIAMMRIFGYAHSVCGRAILGGYRPFSYLGFACGTVYQYALLKIVMTVVFSGLEAIPEYQFDFAALAVSFIVFVFTYELTLYSYARRIQKLSTKSVMLA